MDCKESIVLMNTGLGGLSQQYGERGRRERAKGSLSALLAIPHSPIEEIN